MPETSRRSHRLNQADWLGYALCCVFGALAGWSLLAQRYQTEFGRDPEVLPYEIRFGPTKNSSGPEEWLIRNFFTNERDGTFLDVGAGHYREGNNTYYLETELGWTGIAIDAMAKFGGDYRVHRPGTRFFALFVSDSSGELATLHVNPLNSELSSSSQQWPASRGVAMSREVPTVTLDDLLSSAGLDHIDFVSMDIELSEPKALSGFDLQQFAPRLVCIEAHLPVRQQILDHFQRNGYVLLGSYLRADRFNLYFIPTRAGAQ
jgi:FkbM family methyltransferase